LMPISHNLLKFGLRHLEARKLVKSVYGVCSVNEFKKDCSLVDQIRRTAVSVASNIAEGSSRTSKKDKAHFYQIAFSSLMEVTSQLLIVRDLGFIENQEYERLRLIIYEISNKLNALYKSQLP
jgi:four helix bundle protein